MQLRIRLIDPPAGVMFSLQTLSTGANFNTMSPIVGPVPAIESFDIVIR